MAKKKSSEEPIGDVTREFVKVLERQRKEMEKLAKPFFEYPQRMEKMVKPFLDYQQRTERMTKPIIEYHQKLLEEARKFQKVWAEHTGETIDKVTSQMLEEQDRQREEAGRLVSEMDLPDEVKKFIQNSQKIQEKWANQLRKTTEVMEAFVRKNIK